jgi:3-oxoacyl-[acyl-carrier-protein] synthase III
MESTNGIGILGVGHELPSITEDNDALCRNLGVTPEWIVEKTGIKRRYLASEEDSSSGLGARAATRAMAMAGITAADVDLIIACTFSPDYIFPPVSAKIHSLLGAGQAQIFDVQANCTGFVTGLTLATDRLRADSSIRNALVIGVELNSRYVDRSSVDTAIYLSDGAGAAVVGRCAPNCGILASAFHTDSSNYEAVRMRGGGSAFRRAPGQFDPAVDFMEMNGIATWKQAITHLPTTIRRACAKAGVEVRDVDFFVFHQANYNLIEYVVRKLGFPMSKTFTNVQEIGNTGAASVGIALSEAVARGFMKPGDLVVTAAVGAGFNFGACVWRWNLEAATET